jgi:putative ABC transport system permease protein
VEGRLPGVSAAGRAGLTEIVLGSALARELGVPSLALAPVVRLYGMTWSVVGVIDGGDARPDAARIAVLPWPFARRASRERTEALVRTVPGFQHEIAPKLPAIALPTASSELVAELPAAPQGLRRTVAESIAQAATAIAVVTLVGGLLALFQTTSASVIRRTREIGLRRALGATRRVIAAQIQLEVLVVGAAGSIFGAAIGASAGAVAAHLNDWPLVVPPAHVLGGIVAGVAASALAGAIPAWRASVIDPAAALRNE